jgi:tetratricopeptide (TPR) repeat protein
MNEESLFHEALARSTPEERAAFLDAACAGQPELRAAVESLLAAHEQPGAFLCTPAVASDTTPGDAPSHPGPAHETENLAGSTGADDAPARPVLSDGGLPRTSLDSAAQAAPAPDVPDRVGRYEIRRLLGRGGMGAVYLAHDPELDRPVALKVPKLSGPDAEERFLREARAAAALSHSNLCPVYDVGRADGVPYLAMAYVAGPNLGEMLREDGPPPIARCAAIAAGVARGMAEAHRHGIVHRDLKPGNILLNRRGEPVVTDFGLALRASRTTQPADPAATVAHDPRLTQSGVLMGTPAYMPPEQARGDLDRIGPASDVYALGAILYELLTGRPPFPATPLRDMVRLIETEPTPVPSKVRNKVPPGLDAVCRRAMAKDPAKRFASMEAFAEALAPFAAQRKRRRWGRVAVAAAALALLVAVAGAVFYVKTNYGTVEVRLSDPKADVQVSVDGNEISLTEGGRVTKLRAGPHGLLVKGQGFETETKDFKITRGETTVVTVELRRAGKPGQPLSEPDQARLARLLASGRKLLHQAQFGELEGVAADALKIDPESPGALALRATARAARGDLDGARRDVDAALKLNPETFQALIVRSYLSTRDGKPDDAIADTTAALRIDPASAPAWSNRAKAYIDRKDYRQAIEDASRAIERDAKHVDAYVNRGGAYACLGEYDKALADFKTALELRPNDARIWFQRSALHVKMGNGDKAAADWEKAKGLDPSLQLQNRPAFPDPPKPPERKKLTLEEADALAAALGAAEKAVDESRTADARKAIDEALRLSPTSANAHALHARLLEYTGQNQQALAAANEAIRLDPAQAWAYIARGNAHSHLNDQAAAVADHTIALRLEPKNKAAWNNRGFAYLCRGQYHQALADLNESLRLWPNDAITLANRGSCYLFLGENEKALADYARAAELQPTNGRWLMACAGIRARLGDPDGAQKDRERALKIDPQLANAPAPELQAPIPPVKKDPEPAAGPEPGAALAPADRAHLAGLLTRGRQLVGQGRFGELKPIADEALAIDPESPGALALRATFRAARNDLVGARADAEAALKLNPETLQALIVRQHLSYEDGKYDDAIADLTLAARLEPANALVWANRATSYGKKGEYRQAISDATRAIELGLPRDSAYLSRAAAHACLGDYDKALADFNAAEKAAGDDPAVFLQRSALHIKMGNPKKAAADWEKAQRLDPTVQIGSRPALPDPPKPPERKKLTAEEAGARDAALRAADRALSEHRLTDSRKAVEEALRIDPTSAKAHTLRGRLLGIAGQFDQLLKEADEAIRLDPDYAWAYIARGTAHFELNDPAGAIADHTIAIRLDPKLQRAWNNRGSAYHKRGQYHQAIADQTEALRLLPNDTSALTNRGANYAYLGEYEKALADYARAIDLQPTNTRWLTISAAIRAKLGDPDGARKDRERALKLDPQLANVPDTDLPAPLPPAKKDPELPAGPEPGAAQAPADRDRLARLLARGRELFLHGRLDQFGPIAGEALRIDPESPGALALRAHDRAWRNDLIGARADVDAALKLNPETFHALFLRGYLNLAEEKDDDAIADLTAAIRLEPTIPSLWQNRADCYVRKGEHRQAIADATRAIELGFKPPQALQDRGAAYAHLGQYKEALADFTTAVERAPNNPRVWFQRSALYIKMGQPDKAAADWEKARSLDPSLRIEDRPTIPDPPKPPERKKLTPDEAKELDRAQEAFQRAWNTADLTGCQKAAEEACRIDPTSAAARSAKARILAQTGQFKEALAEANEALRLDPNDAWAYSMRATARTEANDPAGGVADATISLRLDPRIAETWNTRGWAYWRRGQYHQAVTDLNEAIRLRPNYELPYATRGNCWLRLGDYEKALADYTKVSEIQPTAATWRMMCAAIRARTGDPDGARRDREAALKLDPKQGEVILPAPLPPAKTDPGPPPDPAPQAARPPIDRARLAELLANGRKLVDSGHFTQLEAVTNEALSIDPESPGGLELRAVYRQMVQNDRAGARADAEAALKLNPESFYALLVRADLNGHEGRYDDAIADATIARRLDPKHPAPLTRRARAYLEKKEPRQAVIDASLAIDLGYQPQDVFKTRAEAYVFLGEYEKALKDFDTAAARAPGYPPVFMLRSVLHAKLGHADLAAADWKRAKELRPTLTEESRPVIPDPPKPPQRKKLTPQETDALAAALRAGEKALIEHRIEDSRKAIEEAVRLDPTCADAHALRGRLLGHTEQYAQAFVAANEAIRLDPNNAWAYTVRGGARDPKKDPAGAIADHTIALTLDPKLYQAWSNRAHAYNCRGQYHQAVADAAEALRLRPGDWIALRNRGGSRLFLGQYKEALADYVRVTELQPTNGRWLLICAGIRAKLNDPEGAAKDRERALKTDPQLANGPDIVLPDPIPPVKKDPEWPAGER